MIDVGLLDKASLIHIARLLPDAMRRARLVDGAREHLLDYARFENPAYQTPAHIKLLADSLERIERGDINRLAISMPPRHGKSMLTSELFPAWFLGRNPDKFIICSTYAQDLASDFGRKVRNYVADEQFRSVFPEVSLSPDSSAATRFHTNKAGVYFSVGAGGPITGRGAHLLLIDDPVKGAEDADSEAQRRNIIEWYKTVAMTRLQPGGRIVLIGTRWHEEDLIGWALEHTAHENWTVISLPAISTSEQDPLGRGKGEALWPEAYPIERLNELKTSLGSRQWSALYMQSPTTEDGNIFSPKHWQRYKHGGDFECDYIVQAYDTAFSTKETADYTAITTWGVFNDDNGVQCALLLDAFNERLEYPDLRRKAGELYQKWQPDLAIVEARASGQSLIQDLRRSGLPIVEFHPDRDKITRAYAIQPLFEAKRIFVRCSKSGDPREDAQMLIQQAAKFPYGKHDDLVDSMVLALTRLQRGYFVVHPDDPQETSERSKKRGYW